MHDETIPAGPVTPVFLAHIRRKLMLLASLAALMLAVGMLSLTQGAYAVSPLHLIRSLLTGTGDAADIVIWNIRMPRIAAAIATGWGLSLAGLAIQSMLRNPLGSPSTLGISQGAAFGAATAIVFFNGQVLSVTVSAFFGAMAATSVILILARVRHLTPEAIILSGVALSSLFASATILSQYMAAETQLAVVLFWTFGDVARSNWREIGLMTAVTAGASLFFLIRRWDLNALDSGQEAARGLGVNVEWLRIQGMVAAALVAALATAFHGVIAFVGLSAPHIARRLVGADHGLLVPFSGVIGAILILAADTVGRVIVGSGSLPVGVITSCMGAPMFLYLLVRGYRR